MIWFNGFPFLDNKEEHVFGVPVSQVMTKEITSLQASGMDFRTLENLLTQNRFQGFPIIENGSTRILLGYIGRTELRFAIDRAKRDGFISPMATCLFAPTPPTSMASSSRITATTTTPAVTFDDIASSAGQQRIDFSRFIDQTPLTVHPRQPLETVMELFKKLGPRAILVEHRGRLAGLVTVKDCLKYQFQVEARDSTRDHSALDHRQEQLWAAMTRVAELLAELAGRCTGGRLRLGGVGGNDAGGGGATTFLESDTRDPRDHRSPIRAAGSRSGRRILDGTEDDEDDEAGATELADRS